jgi:hypothetical protein
MADRALVISWGDTVPGREERALEVFNEALGICGRMQQDGRIESFDVVLLTPNGDISGYIEMHGSAAQVAAVSEDEEFQRNTADASLIVQKLRHVVAFTNEAVAQQMAMYQDAIGKVPQAS